MTGCYYYLRGFIVIKCEIQVKGSTNYLTTNMSRNYETFYIKGYLHNNNGELKKGNYFLPKFFSISGKVMFLLFMQK